MARTDTVGKTATSVYTDSNGWICVQYHDTVVIKWNSQSITLDSGGRLTKTTKLRINQASNQYNLGVQVYQQKGVWFVSHMALAEGVAPFVDGMTIPR
jgi:hypothetical protein